MVEGEEAPQLPPQKTSPLLRLLANLGEAPPEGVQPDEDEAVAVVEPKEEKKESGNGAAPAPVKERLQGRLQAMITSPTGEKVGGEDEEVPTPSKALAERSRRRREKQQQPQQQQSEQQASSTPPPPSVTETSAASTATAEKELVVDGRLFRCPLTKARMAEPVIAMDGHTYEKKAMIEWMGGERGMYSPVTGERLESNVLVPNRLVELQLAVARWRS